MPVGHKAYRKSTPSPANGRTQLGISHWKPPEGAAQYGPNDFACAKF